MNTRGNTQQDARVRLVKAIEGMSDPEAIQLFDRLAIEKAKRGERPLEEPMYPLEFLNAINETAFKALEDWLMSQQAPEAAVKLLEDLNILGTWKNEVEKSNGMVGNHVNMFLQDTVSSLTLHVAAIGGVFYAPYGQTPRRENVK